MCVCNFLRVRRRCIILPLLTEVQPGDLAVALGATNLEARIWLRKHKVRACEQEIMNSNLIMWEIEGRVSKPKGYAHAEWQLYMNDYHGSKSPAHVLYCKARLIPIYYPNYPLFTNYLQAHSVLMGKVNVASLLRPSTFPLPQLMSASVYGVLDRMVTRRVSIRASTTTPWLFMKRSH